MGAGGAVETVFAGGLRGLRGVLRVPQHPPQIGTAGSGVTRGTLGRAQVCPQATKDDIARFQNAMGVCFKAAVDAGLSIAVSARPRLPPAGSPRPSCALGSCMIDQQHRVAVPAQMHSSVRAAACSASNEPAFLRCGCQTHHAGVIPCRAEAIQHAQQPRRCAGCGRCGLEYED